jgi:hypothetical protein
MSRVTARRVAIAGVLGAVLFFFLQDKLRLDGRAEGDVNAGPIRPLTVQIPDPIGLPPKSRLVLLGYDDRAAGELPIAGDMPDFYWKSPTTRVGREVSVNAPLPPDLALMAVLDVDGDGRPGDLEWTTGLFVAPAEGPVFRSMISHMGDLGEAVFEPRSSILIDASAWSAANPDATASILFAGYAPPDVEDGLPRPDARPVFLRVEDPARVQSKVELRAVLPEPGLPLFAVLDVDGDYLPSPNDPIARGVRDGAEILFTIPE